MLAAIFLTGSKGAVLAAACGLFILLMLHPLQALLRRHWRVALALGWAGVLLGSVVVTAYGLARGGLPGSSLAFRWNYWQVTTRIIGEHPWTGVGALNFDHAYMRLKPIDFPEEIRDPHNFVLSIVAQWGLPGLIGMTLAAVGASLSAARQWAQTPAGHAAELLAPEDARRALRRWIPVVSVAFVLLRVWLLHGLLGTSSGQAAVFVDLVQYGLVWIAVFAAVATLATTPAGRGGLGPRLVLLCGLVAFLLHNTIDFSLFLPGPLTVFAGLAGSLLGYRSSLWARSCGKGSDSGESQAADCLPATQAVAKTSRSCAGWVPVGVAASGLVLVLSLVFAPVRCSSAALAQARSLPPAAAGPFYEAAAAADPLDPVPLSEQVERFTRNPEPGRLDAVLAALDGAIARDPQQVSLHRWRSQLYDLRFSAGGADSDLQAAIASARHVIELYPQSPDEHLNLATILAHAAVAKGSAHWAREARDEYAKALALDVARPGTDEVRKWLPSRRAAIEAAMNALPVPVSTRASQDMARPRPDGAPASQPR